MRHGLVLALSIFGLVGCAGAQAPSTAPAASRQDPAGPVQVAVASTAGTGAQAQGAAAPASTAAPSPAAVPPPADRVTPPPPVPPAARQAVEDAYDAMKKNRWDALEALVPAAAADPLLGRYPRYWLLRHRVLDRTQPVPVEDIRDFLKDDSDPYLNERLRADWIVAAVRGGDYAQALQIKPVANPSSRVQCALMLARKLTGQRVRAADFLQAYQPNTDCWDLLDQLAADHVLSRRQLNDLLRDTLEAGKVSAANRVAAATFDDAAMVQYAALMKAPRRWLETRPAPRQIVDYELAAIALSRLARSGDRVEAAQYIQQHWATRMPKADLQWVWGQFGLVAALNTAPDATRWYRLSGYAAMTDYNHAWEVRSELRSVPLDWSRVAAAIRKMGAAQADEPVWRYWYGRALAAQGNEKAARQYFESIAGGLDFYGQLATEALGRTPALPVQPPPVDPGWVAQARSNRGLQRAVALFDLGWRREAVPEWNNALRGMMDPQLRGAAEMARQEQIYDRVVNTSLQTQHVVDFSQRFIAPFEGQVAEKAAQIDLDPAWVYGLIRQESRFITDVRSHAGASGLMQLMPATARWVARKIGMKDFTLSKLNDFDTNTVLGTRYLDIVLRGLDGSQLLATAGYNAGPGRSKRWRASLQGPVEGAIFAETIPFTETRLYVKHVMSNATYYAMIFSGQPQSLAARLGTVSPAPGAQAARP